MAYTYRIGWSKLNKHYYGVRYSKRSHPSDLWNKKVAKAKMKKCTDGLKIYDSINDLAKAYGLKHSGAKYRIISTTYNWSLI